MHKIFFLLFVAMTPQLYSTLPCSATQPAAVAQTRREALNTTFVPGMPKGFIESSCAHRDFERVESAKQKKYEALHQKLYRKKYPTLEAARAAGDLPKKPQIKAADLESLRAELGIPYPDLCGILYVQLGIAHTSLAAHLGAVPTHYYDKTVERETKLPKGWMPLPSAPLTGNLKDADPRHNLTALIKYAFSYGKITYGQKTDLDIASRFGNGIRHEIPRLSWARGSAMPLTTMSVRGSLA